MVAIDDVGACGQSAMRFSGGDQDSTEVGSLNSERASAILGMSAPVSTAQPRNHSPEKCALLHSNGIWTSWGLSISSLDVDAQGTVKEGAELKANVSDCAIGRESSAPKTRTDQEPSSGNDPVTMESIREGIQELKNSIQRWSSATTDALSGVNVDQQSRRSISSIARKLSLAEISSESSKTRTISCKATNSSNKENVTMPTPDLEPTTG